jgi:hypothetical protein
MTTVVTHLCFACELTDFIVRIDVRIDVMMCCVVVAAHVMLMTRPPFNSYDYKARRLKFQFLMKSISFLMISRIVMGMGMVIQQPRRPGLLSASISRSSYSSGTRCSGTAPGTDDEYTRSTSMTMRWPKDAVKVPYVGCISYYYRINGNTHQRSIDRSIDGDTQMEN